MGHQSTGSHGFKNLTLAIPDPDTFQILPFGDKDAAEARVFCDIHHLDGSAFTGDPRQVLRRHVEAARGEGLTFYIALDIEFFYFTPPQPGERPTPLDFGATLTSPPETSLATSANKRFAPSNKSGSRLSTHSMKILPANRKSIFVTTMLSPLPTR